MTKHQLTKIILHVKYAGQKTVLLNINCLLTVKGHFKYKIKMFPFQDYVFKKFKLIKNFGDIIV